MIFSGFVCAEDNLSALVDTTSQDMIEISVEVTEINNDKASELGIKWFDTIQTGEISYTLGGRTPESLPEIPSILKGGDWARIHITAELKMLQTKELPRFFPTQTCYEIRHQRISYRRNIQSLSLLQAAYS